MKHVLWILALVAVPGVEAGNLTAEDLDAVDGLLAKRSLPIYQEMAGLRMDFENQTVVMEAVLVALRADMAGLEANLSASQEARLAALSDRLAAQQAHVLRLEDALAELDNLTAAINERLASGDVDVRVDSTQVEAAVQNVVAGQAFQSRLQNGVEAASSDLATRGDVATVASSQPPWWLAWLPSFFLAALGAVYHFRIVQPLLQGRKEAEAEEATEEETQEETEEDASEEEALEAARRMVQAHMARFIAGPPAATEPPPAPPSATKRASEATNGIIDERHSNGAAASNGRDAPVAAAPATKSGDIEDQRVDEAREVAEDEALSEEPVEAAPSGDPVQPANKAEEEDAEELEPLGGAISDEEPPEGKEPASGSAPADQDAAAPARKYWKQYQEGKLDGESLNLALADAYPDVDERMEMLQQVKEAT